MKVLFAGTPDFAIPTLKGLIQSNHEVLGVLTQPDKPKGRGQKLMMSPVKKLAIEHDITVLQPTSLKEEKTQSHLKAMGADIMVVIAYGLILPEAILKLFPHGCINVHASLLPKYRGASPIQAALLMGDKHAGVTIMAMDKGMDTGDMLLKAECKISDDETSHTLHDKLSEIGATTLIETLELIDKENITSQKQNNDDATYANKILKSDAEIKWEKSAELIDREVRAYYGWPVSFTSLEGSTIRVWEASVVSNTDNAAPGEIISLTKEAMTVACGDGALNIKKIQLPGGKVLSIKDCLNAKPKRFQVGKILGA